MSAELTSRGFALLLDEFVRGELDADRARACERHLESNAAARAVASDATRLLLSPAWRAAGSPPAGLLEGAMSATRRRLEAASAPRRSVLALATPWRRALALAAAVAAVATVLLLAWPSSAPPAFADVLARLRDVEGVQVEGWVLGPSGRREPWRQWVAADGSFRAEVGDAENRRLVAWRDGVRLVRDAAGRLYRFEEPEAALAGRDEVQQLLRRLEAMSRDGSLAVGSRITAEDIGEATRFTRLQAGPLGGPELARRVLEVDNRTSLPRSAAVEERVGEAWVRTGELEFTGFDVATIEDLFRTSAPTLAPGEDDHARLWFELGISLRSLETPAVTAPAGDSEVRRLSATDAGAGTNGGGYTYREAGVTTLGIYNLSVDNLVRGLGGPDVIDNDAARQRVSLEVRTKTALPWRRQLAAALDSLGLHAEVVTHETARRRFVFRQDGRAIAPSRFDLDNMSIRADVDGYRYLFEHQHLGAVVTNLLGNSSLRRDARDTVVFAVPAGDGRDPFRTAVDVEFHNPNGSWETNLSVLRDKFGVTLEVIEETLERQAVELRVRSSPESAPGRATPGD